MVKLPVYGQKSLGMKKPQSTGNTILGKNSLPVKNLKVPKRAKQVCPL